MKNKYILKYIKSDVYRYYGKASVPFIMKSYLFDPMVRYHVTLRMASGEGAIQFIGKVLHKLCRKSRTILIQPSMTIGYGLYIGHGGPAVLTPLCTLGNNVNLSQFTSIGSNDGERATIGDNTYIGPNVCIVEGVHIGSNVTIGAGSVVTKDIPDNATAAGNYAKVLNYNNPGRYTMNNRWTDCTED